jgi:hypothetical protein
MSRAQGSGWYGESRRHAEAAKKGRGPIHQPRPVKHYDNYPGGGPFEFALDGTAQNIEDRLRDGEKKEDVEWEIEEVKGSYDLLDREHKASFKAHAQKNYPRFSKQMGWRTAPKQGRKPSSRPMDLDSETELINEIERETYGRSRI